MYLYCVDKDLQVCMCTTFAQVACGGWRRVLDPWNWVYRQVGAAMWGKNRKHLNTDLSFQPLSVSFKR